ncbi:hypothetical protein B1R32_12213 [Abditibacterium utsteinense]|uniref:Uncharacterized protein n=1 Tax=Abditibacterium utsteinense TaxID=1960156 RepID=A0A2S8SPR4_9BACT|nr:hypothetical protein [Abditibacterium utsteinense]PQV62766.1 hypothetical protein B1R32_12213 [Abditibacterium utsteinense]
MTADFQFQPFELVFDAPKQNGPAEAEGEFRFGPQKMKADLREIDGFLFFNSRGGDIEQNFLVASMHSAISHPPRRAFEKLGRAQTLVLLQRRALNLGFWGRLFVFKDEKGARFLIFLGESGRHLLTSSREISRNARAEWTPFEWDLTPDLVQTSSSQLFSVVEREWKNPASNLNRVKSWSEADYFERLWQSLEFQNGDAQSVQRILRAAASLVAPDEGAHGWILRFQLPEKAGKIDLYEQLFEEYGSRQVLLGDAIYARLQELLNEFAPRRMRGRDAAFLAQREWLESNSGVGNWSLSVHVAALSAHEKLETALQLRADLQKIWPNERVAAWMAPFLSGE